MATILFIKTAKFTMTPVSGSGAQYEGDAADVHVEVEAGETIEYPTLDGNVAANTGPESYTLVMRAGQDYSTTGLARFMWDNADAIVDIILNAHGMSVAASDATPEVRGQVKLIPVAYGGEVSTFAEFEVTLPFISKPTLESAPAAAATAARGKREAA